MHAHTSQRSYCRDFLYELSTLYTFETLEKFHYKGRSCQESWLEDDSRECLISTLSSNLPLSTDSSRSWHTSNRGKEGQFSTLKDLDLSKRCLSPYTKNDAGELRKEAEQFEGMVSLYVQPHLRGDRGYR